MNALKLMTTAVAATLILTACGGGSSDSSGTNTNKSAETSPSNALVNPIEVYAPTIPPVTGVPQASALSHIKSKLEEQRKQAVQCPNGKSYPASQHKTLGVNFKLNEAASAHAKDMAEYNYFSHESRNGATATVNGKTPAQQDFEARLKAVGYDYTAFVLGENLVTGSDVDSIDKAIAAWIASPDHCEDVMNPEYNTFGIGYAQQAEGSYNKHYWALILSTATE